MIKVPNIDQVKDIDNYYDVFESKFHNRITFYQEEIPVSPITSRFHFDFNFHYENRELFKDVDVVINDENTLTKNWNSLFYSLGLNIPIISANYFLDSPIASKVDKKVSYYERQMEAMINSDICAFPSNQARLEAFEAFDILFKNRESLIKKSSVWNVGCYAKEVMDYNYLEKYDIPTIYFGNRITESANRYTNWHVFAEAIGKLSEVTDKPFNAFITNPTRKITEDQVEEIKRLSNGKIYIPSNDENPVREDYLEKINRSHISVNLFTRETNGGVTHAEALLANNILVMPKINNYYDNFKSMGYEDYPFFVSYKDDENKSVDVDDLVEKLKNALGIVNTSEERYYNKICKEVGFNCESYEAASGKILEDINYVIENKE